MTRRSQCLCLVLVPFAVGGCSTLLGQEIGASYAVGKPEQSAFAAAAYAGLGDGRSNGGNGLGLELRAKGGPKMGQFAVGPMVYLLAGPDEASPKAIFVARGGFALAQLESVEGRFGFGMFSPHFSAGISLALTRNTRLFVMPEVEYDLRFTGQASTGYVSLMIGIGAASYGSAQRHREPVR